MANQTDNKDNILSQYIVPFKKSPTGGKRGKNLQSWRKYIIPSRSDRRDNISERVDDIAYGVKRP